MKELLKSFAYTLVGFAAFGGIMLLVGLFSEAINHASPPVRAVIVISFLLVVFTLLVHTIRRR